ncbi:MAG: DEAD/DEAH box helicase family protein [Desulfobacterales bacterium]|nr:DEAD/DEAH box helicase family protein [Desulfobacterales bacterium]
MATQYSLQDVPIKNTYSSLETDLVDELVVPLLQRAVQYDRGVGFFTSGWLKEAAKGLLSFVKHNGKARIITSPNLSEQDWQTIKVADEQRQGQMIVAGSIENALSDLKKKLEYDTLAALAWLIRDGILEFCFAIPQGNLAGGIFHSKLSIFIDPYGNGVALHGSQNDSVQASLNEESYSAFCSWNEGVKWFDEHCYRFNQIWNNLFPKLRVLKVPEVEKEKLIRYTKEYPRPYPAPSVEGGSTAALPPVPSLHPVKTPRDYQKKAIAKWEEQGRRGIFEMATGTGKTITAILAAVNVFQQEGSLALVVLVPYKHLVDQWIEELRGFGFLPIPCYESINTWKKVAANSIREVNARLVSNLCLVSTHQTASMEPFRKMISRLHSPFLLLGDEIHELGAAHYRKALSEHAPWRIGLSATPDRWYDEEGTSFLRTYFGETVIKYELDQAIKDKALTPYQYYLEKIDFNTEEIAEYLRLSKLIAQLSTDAEKNQTRLEDLLRRRADLIGKAANKIPRLLAIVQAHRKACEVEGEKYQHILVYCNKGTHREVLTAMAGLGLRMHEFVHDVPLVERRKILDAFSKGEIDGLVAIRCLDQGVDVPATRRAYILASSTNPREFVQRRGRILRKAEGKQFAQIYDFLVGPWNTTEVLSNESARGLLLRELPRFAEVSLDAINSQEARNAIWYTVMDLDLVAYLRKRPWEVYQEMQQRKLDQNYER